MGRIKRLKAVVLNPRTLRYVRREDGKEIEVSLDEVRPAEVRPPIVIGGREVALFRMFIAVFLPLLGFYES